MLVAQHGAVTEPASVVDGRVVLLVAYDIIVASDYGAYYSQIALESRGERYHSFLAEEFRQFRLQFQVELQRSVKEARTGAACSVLFKGIQTCLNDLVVYRKPQVVVGAEHYAALTFHYYFRILPGFQRVEEIVNAQFPVFVGYRKLRALFEKIDHLDLLSLYI